MLENDFLVFRIRGLFTTSLQPTDCFMTYTITWVGPLVMIRIVVCGLSTIAMFNTVCTLTTKRDLLLTLWYTNVNIVCVHEPRSTQYYSCLL